MSKQKETLLIIIPAQFGYSVPHYYWCKYLKEKYKITYYSYDQGFACKTIKGIDTIQVPFKDNKIYRIFNFYRNALKTLRKNKFDKVIIVQYKLDFIYKLFHPLKKINYDIRTGGVNKNKILRGLHNIQIVFSSYLFSNTIILSESLRKKLRISKRKSSLVDLGADTLATNEKTFENLNLFYIGTFTGRDLVKTIVGFSIFLKNNSKSTYTIIGFGTEKEQKILEEKVNTLKISENVFILGRKTHSEALKYFENCNVGVSFIPCTPYYDKQPPTKTYEYLLSGLVCLATNTSENRRIINSINGVLINDNPEDFNIGLNKIIASKEAFSSGKIRQSVIGFTWQNIVTKKLIPSLK